MCGCKEYPFSGVTNYGRVQRKGARKRGLERFTYMLGSACKRVKTVVEASADRTFDVVGLNVLGCQADILGTNHRTVWRCFSIVP